MDEPRTEQPTTRKLQRARARGLVARSPDLAVAAGLLALALVLIGSGPRLVGALEALVVAGLRAAAGPLSASDPLAPLLAPAREVALLSLRSVLAIAAAAAAAGFVQVGPLFAPAALAPDFARLSPPERLRALLAPDRLPELGLAALKLALLLFAAWSALRPHARDVFQLPLVRPAQALPFAGALLRELAVRTGLALAAIGAVDVLYRRIRHARSLRMGRRELREEQRESYGAPEIRERVRRAQAEARARLAAAGTAEASLLLLDGAGRALALAFDAADLAQRAPRVLEKGAGTVAQRMHAAADAHAVPVRLAPALTRALFQLELTETIPAQHYTAVAELFAGLPSRQS
jgi:flagellar biosynthetic protein FlhB